MRVLFAAVLCVGVLALTGHGSPQPAGPGQAKEQPAVLGKIRAMKPVPIDANDPPLKKLQKELFNARLEQVQYLASEQNRGNLNDLPPAIDRFVESAAELEDGPDGRVKWYELRLEVLRENERAQQTLVDRKAAPPRDLLDARAARIDAEIKLLKVKNAAKSGK